MDRDAASIEEGYCVVRRLNSGNKRNSSDFPTPINSFLIVIVITVFVHDVCAAVVYAVVVFQDFC